MSRTVSQTILFLLKLQSRKTVGALGLGGPKTRKNPKIRVIIIMAFFGNFMVILGLNNIFKFLIGFFRSGLA